MIVESSPNHFKDHRLLEELRRLSDGGNFHFTRQLLWIYVLGNMQEIHFKNKLPKSSLMGRHSEGNPRQLDIKDADFPKFKVLKDIVGRVLSLLEFGGDSAQKLVEDVVEESEGEFVLEVDESVLPVAGNLTDQQIIS